MWRIYSSDYIKYNRTSGLSIMAASFICTSFLSLLCCLFFHFWLYDVRQIIHEEGDWQVRLTGDFDENDMAVINSFAHVEQAVSDTGAGAAAASIYFKSMKYVYEDMSLMAEKLNIDPENILYHEALLEKYLVFPPQGGQPSYVLFFYLAVLLIMIVSLILIIRNAFFTFMNARIHQLGILMSVGAAPGQILACLLQEAAILCSLPILAGSAAGMGLCALFIWFFEHIAGNVQLNRLPAAFHFQPQIWLAAVLLSALTVLTSAWFPAWKLSRISVLDAIRAGTETQIRTRRRFPPLSGFRQILLRRLFGPLGELAGNSLRARRRSLRTTTLSLTLSFLAFAMFLCFMTISSASVRQTYFERYKDAWDIMVTVENTDSSDLAEPLAEKIRGLENIKNIVSYQKAGAYAFLPNEQISSELYALGGLPALTGNADSGDVCSVNTTLVILDDRAFSEYCEQVQIIPPANSGAILINSIWDSTSSTFHQRMYIPFIEETGEPIHLETEAGKTLFDLPVAGYTQTPPLLREEYADYALVCILPRSLWSSLCETVPEAERFSLTGPDTFLRILVSDSSNIQETADSIQNISGEQNSVHIEDRISEEISNEKIWNGYRTVVGSLCALLAVIGIANIFSDTLGFVRQRRREFARYLSIGMTPEEMRRLLGIEVLSIAGRPLMVTLPLTALFVVFALRQSRVSPADFITHLPLLPILCFLLLIFLFVGLAYYMGARNIFRCDLTEVLKDDTMI